MSPHVNTYLREYGHLTLAYAAANGHQAIVKSLWQRGVSINNKIDEFGETPLSAAAANGHVHVVRFLIDKGARLLSKGVTPLHRAAQNGHVAVARVLLQQCEVDYARASYPHTMDPQIMLMALDRSGERPLQKAARNGHHEVVKVMLVYAPSKGPNFYCMRKNIEKALCVAAANGHLEVIKLLNHDTNFDVDLNISDKHGQTPLISAAKRNHTLVIQWLLAQDVVHSRDGSSVRTAMHHAVSGGHEEAVQASLEHDPHLVDPEMLFSAAQAGFDHLLETLIDALRKQETSSSPERTKVMILVARQKALEIGFQETAQLLDTCWKRKSS
ncbi:MAG: hypothetical protein Q9224_006785 [Gallowayella concinna]